MSNFTANAADFSDDADINYDEAIDVMVAAGIIDGIGNNQFDPKGTLTRAQTANDDFGRPSYTWSYDKKDIGIYVDRDQLHIEYTTEVTGEMLYNDIGSSTLKDASVTVYIDGVDNASTNSAVFGKGNIVKSNTKKVGDAGNGVLTQVFIDTEGDEADITIAIVNTYLTKAAEDYDERSEDIALYIYGLKLIAGKANKDPLYGKDVDRDEPSVSITVENDDIDVSYMKEDDIVLVTVADGKVQSTESPEVVSNVTITNFKKDKYVTADGTQYDYASAALYDEEALNEYNDKNMKDLTYNVYLDEYGYAIGVEKNEEPVFVAGVDGNGSNFSSKNADVNVIFLDGTMKVVEVDVKDSDINFSDGAIINTLCTYTVDKKGVYTLEQVADAISTANKIKVAQSAQNADDETGDNITIDKKHVSLDGGSGYDKVYGNDNTVYINVELEMINSSTSFKKTGTNGKLGADTLDKDGKVTTSASGARQNYVQTNSTAQTKAAIIDDVESVTVGVKDVSLDIKNIVKTDYDDSTEMAVPLNEVYTLYKDNGYVIAAVVIGDSGGVSSSYAYITSDTYSNKGYTGLEKSIRDLDTNFKGWLSVLFEDGMATVIVFNDTTGTTVDTGKDNEIDNRITDAEYDGRETLTICYFTASAYSDKAKATNDLARFLGAAHTERNVKTITFNDEDYKWDDDALGADGYPVLGSKRHKAADDEYCDTTSGDKTKNTLIGDIVTYANGSLGSLQIELDGVEYTLNFATS